ncbi:putative xylanase 3 [Purpureocillium lavendulum]|uniref:Xylanase 3 n=1 Tax=Purpureocillium lavendulum TaxID=1247861 RepID=A0AB34G6V7_9HYPO|nr:putative xylanase 3 [Purpureocillium lavendulum]
MPLISPPRRLSVSRCLRVLLVLSLVFFVLIVAFSVPSSPPTTTPRYGAPELNTSKLALLVEDRPQKILAPVLLHFIGVLPPSWPLLFLGSPASLAALNASAAARAHVRTGKLSLAPIPANMSTAGQEMVSRFLTSRWLYETAVAAEWLLVFQTDATLCANSRLDMDRFVGLDWVGAPWTPDARWGGNGGLSLRRVSRIVEVLRNQQRREDSEPEDVWLSERLAHFPGANVANGSVSLTFSGEMHSGAPEGVPVEPRFCNGTLLCNEGHEHVAGIDDWRTGFYEPMGYHTGGSGQYLHPQIWGTPEIRRHIYDYCPEVKMTLAMDMTKYVPGSCAGHW